MLKKWFLNFSMGCVVTLIFIGLLFCVLGPMLIAVFTNCSWWLLLYIGTIPALMTTIITIGQGVK